MTNDRTRPIETTHWAGTWMTMTGRSWNYITGWKYRELCSIRCSSGACGSTGAIVKHLGILATTPEGAALCFRAFCQQGTAELGPHDHPDVTLDCIALARSLPAWEKGDLQPVRATLSVSVHRLAGAGADFFACPDNPPDHPLARP